MRVTSAARDCGSQDTKPSRPLPAGAMSAIDTLLEMGKIEWPEETMELTLPPAGHETIGKDPVHQWQVSRIARLGIPWPVAEAAAGHVDWHQLAALMQRGCPPGLALRILR